MRKITIVILTLTLLCTGSLQCQEYLKILDGEQVVDSLLIYQDTTESNEVVAKFFFIKFPSQLAKAVYLRNGKPNGVYKSYFPNGVLMEFSIYGNGIRHGEMTVYDENGEILIKGKYKDGLKHGFWSYIRKGYYGRFRKGTKKGTWLCYSGHEVEKMRY